MTALPTTQRFYRGHRVRIGEMPEHMRHFDGNCAAIVIGSYNDTCGLGGHGCSERHAKSYSLLLLKLNGTPWTTVSWYQEDQLMLIDTDRDAGETIIQQYIVGNCR